MTRVAVPLRAGITGEIRVVILPGRLGQCAVQMIVIELEIIDVEAIFVQLSS